MPSYRIVRVSDELHHATLWIQARPELAERIGHEFPVDDARRAAAGGMRETWPEILRIVQAGKH